MHSPVYCHNVITETHRETQKTNTQNKQKTKTQKHKTNKTQPNQNTKQKTNPHEQSSNVTDTSSWVKAVN